MAAPVIARQFDANTGHRADEPSATTTAGGGDKSQLVTATLTQIRYSRRVGQPPRAPNLGKLLDTATAGGNKPAVAAASLAKHCGGNYTDPGVAPDKSVHSVTTVNHRALVTLHPVKLWGICCDGQHIGEPMPTIIAGGQCVGEANTLLAINDYDERRVNQAKEFLNSSGISELVMTKGIVYRIVDIGACMLQSHEFYRTQGPPEWYIIGQDYRGVKYAKDKQITCYGNAVPPPFAEALMKANLPELCVNREEFAA